MNNLGLVPACADFVDGVATKDVNIRDGTTWVRIFRPEQRQEKQSPLPVVLYAHGGAYTLGDPDWPPFHNFCATMARLSGALWISLSYRLAPHHRLPAAYEDAMEFLLWLSSSASSAQDPWLDPSIADFSNAFLAGESAGACIVLNVAMNAAPKLVELRPLCIRGILLIQPGFHTEAKRGTMIDPALGDMAVDKVYDMALPEGETLDYPPINPIHERAPPLTPLSAYPNIIVTTASEDFRYDLTLIFFDRLKLLCPEARLFVSPGKDHVFHFVEPECPEAQDMVAQLVDFIKSCTVHN